MKTYLVSEEVLRQVLDALEDLRNLAMESNPHWKNKPHHYSTEALRTALAKEPNEPYAWAICWEDDEGHYGWRFSEPEEINGKTSFPLYRKDA